MNKLLLLGIIGLLVACSPNEKKEIKTVKAPSQINLNLEQANRLAALPLECIMNPLPYKSGIVIAQESDLAMPMVHHPAFYGCFDWHSAVHGHWSLIYLLKEFPNLEQTVEARKRLSANLSQENIGKEIDYFLLNKYTKSFERTYGWAWLLKLQEELFTWDDPMAKELYSNIKPLAVLISKKYQEYLPKLVYPIRVGEHSNSAFGLSFALDYAMTVGDKKLEESIKKRALSFYESDQGCPMNWEPSGYDFLSPCLQEVDIMRKVLSDEDFDKWFTDFFQNDEINKLTPAKIIDRTDGKLVHLDGLNFSRAWCLYPVVKSASNIQSIADEHLEFSLNNIVDGDYMGEHWLASFALYALKMKKENGL